MSDRCCHLANRKSSLFRRSEATARCRWEFDPNIFHASVDQRRDVESHSRVRGKHSREARLWRKFLNFAS